MYLPQGPEREDRNFQGGIYPCPVGDLCFEALTLGPEQAGAYSMPVTTTATSGAFLVASCATLSRSASYEVPLDGCPDTYENTRAWTATLAATPSNVAPKAVA